MRIIVGLGNPGANYNNTRHNIGFDALDYLFPEAKWREEKKFQALIAEYPAGLLIKPQTFMNKSGEAVQKVLSYYGLLPTRLGLLKIKNADLNQVLTVIHDDIDLDFGKVKIAHDSGSAGHNGIKSIINHLKTQKFARIRLGIKNELLKNPTPVEKFVLTRFSAEENKNLAKIFTLIEKENIY